MRFKHQMITLLFVAMAVMTNTRTFAQTASPFDTTDTHARFPGGTDGFHKFLRENLEYPLAARENTIEGNVIARFSVSKDGQISNIRILKGFGFGCNEEVIRVLEMMPAWIPAKKDGQAIDTFVIIPVQFRLADF